MLDFFYQIILHRLREHQQTTYHAYPHKGYIAQQPHSQLYRRQHGYLHNHHYNLSYTAQQVDVSNCDSNSTLPMKTRFMTRSEKFLQNKIDKHCRNPLKVDQLRHQAYVIPHEITTEEAQSLSAKHGACKNLLSNEVFNEEAHVYNKSKEISDIVRRPNSINTGDEKKSKHRIESDGSQNDKELI